MKLLLHLPVVVIVMSHPVRVCGLKRALATVERMERLSHPVRVCGLKRA